MRLSLQSDLGLLAQLVQSTCLTSRGSAVRSRVLPLQSLANCGAFLCPVMFTFYILHSATLSKYYTGHTGDDINSRLQKHLTDHAGFTAQAKDWILVYSELYQTKALAYQRERQVKG